MPSLLAEDHDAPRAWLAGLEAKAAPAPVSSGTGYGGWGGWGIAADGLGPAAGDVPLHMNVVVAACVGWLGRNFPVADLRVIRETTAGDGEEIEGHAAIDLLNRPNPTDDFFSFWAPFLLSDSVDGNTFYVKVRNRLGIHSLWWAPPWDVDVIPDPDNDADRPIKSFRIRTAKGVAEYAPEDVIHIKDGKDPANPLRGLAPLKAGIRSASTIDRAELYTSTLMRNMGAVSYMLSPADPHETIHPDSVVQLREQFTERTSGGNNGKPFVSPQGLKADRMGLSPEEMALDRIREFPTAALCALIGTPAMAVGLPDPGKTYSNYDVALRAAWENGLIPRQARAAEAFGRQCPELIDVKTERLKWDYSHVKALQEDENAKIDGLVKATGKPFLTRNEARDQLHLDAIDGWDAQDEEPPPPPVIAPPPGLPGKRPQAALPPPEKGKMDRPFERKAKGDAAARRMIDAARTSSGLTADDTPEGRRALCHAVSERAAAELRTIGEDLAAELDTKALADAIGRAFQAMGRMIRTGALAATLALRGPDGLDEEDRAELTAAVAEQGEYLDGFKAAVIDGTQEPGGIAARAEMYGRAAWAVAHQVERAKALASGVTEERRMLGAAESHCTICPQLADRGWVEARALPGIGQTPCLTSCRCWFEYR
jgi:HK97 family phage portal protein